MKKVMLLTGAMLVLASVAFASPDKSKKPAEKTEISCAVMKGDMISIKKATADKMFADYKGRRYFFCCAGCPEKFKANPAQYAKNDSIPVPKVINKGAKPKKS